jgi:enamine deaminase RidA (YjgF/YER057c/UK114 family)
VALAERPATVGAPVGDGGAEPPREKTMKRTLSTAEFSHYPRVWHFSPVLDTGDFVFLSGLTGTHSDQSVAVTPEAQFRDTFRFLQANLEAAGLTFGHIVEMTTYHVGLRQHLDTFIKVKDEFMLEPFPAWTAFGVTELITAGTLVEIRVIAKRI